MGIRSGSDALALNRCKQAPVQRKLRMRSATTFACVSHTKCPAPGMTSKFGMPWPSLGVTAWSRSPMHRSTSACGRWLLRPAPHGVAQRAQVGAIEAGGGLRPGRLAQPVRVHLRRCDALAPDEPLGQLRRALGKAGGEEDGVPRAPCLERKPRRDLDPRVRSREGDDLAEALGVAGREQQAGEAAPVVAGEVGPLDPERVEQRDQVVGEDVGVDRAWWRVAPAEAAQVGHDQAADVAQALHHAAPLVPVLGPAVDEQQRLAGSGLGDVHAKAAHLDEPVLDPCDGREVVAHAAASIRPMTSAAPCFDSGSLRLPHLGDCTHEGQPLSHGHSVIRRWASSTSASKAR